MQEVHGGQLLEELFISEQGINWEEEFESKIQSNHLNFHILECLENSLKNKEIAINETSKKTYT